MSWHVPIYKTSYFLKIKKMLKYLNIEILSILTFYLCTYYPYPFG